jgi:ABC-2 type transport system permease protein
MGKILKYRNLIFELALRDLKVRYRKPYLGFFWMMIIPLSTAFIYKVLFCDFMKISSGQYPYFIHLVTAMFPWSYFASSLQIGTGCILSSKNIIDQISFPKYLLPVATVFSGLLNFLPSILIIVIFSLLFKVKLTFLILLLPLAIVIQTCLIIGITLMTCALQVVYRDVEYILQISLMALFFLIPSVYTLEELMRSASPAFVRIYMLNPLVGIQDLYRIMFIGGYLETIPDQVNVFNTVLWPIIFSVAALFLGYFVFKKYEARFPDYLEG